MRPFGTHLQPPNVMFAAELRQLHVAGFYQGWHIGTFGRLYRRSSPAGARAAGYIVAGPELHQLVR